MAQDTTRWGGANEWVNSRNAKALGHEVTSKASDSARVNSETSGTKKLQVSNVWGKDGTDTNKIYVPFSHVVRLRLS